MPCDLNRGSRLADAAGPGQGEEAMRCEKRFYVGDFFFPAHKRGQARRQIVPCGLFGAGAARAPAGPLCRSFEFGVLDVREA